LTDIDRRLLSCFQAVFPEIEPNSLPDARSDAIETWDSLRTLLLVSVVEEEFAIRIPPRDYPSLRSYAAIRRYLAGLGEARVAR
jgi:acyl carrier protein